MPRHDDDGDEDDNDDGDEDLDVNVEALAGRALRGLCGELALLKEESEEREEGVLVDLPLVRLELGLVRHFKDNFHCFAKDEKQT